jgi:hypothetical protein
MATMAATLRARLDAWFAQFVDPLLDGARKPVTGCGQLGRVPASGDAADVFADVPIKALRIAPARS